MTELKNILPAVFVISTLMITGLYQEAYGNCQDMPGYNPNETTLDKIYPHGSEVRNCVDSGYEGTGLIFIQDYDDLLHTSFWSMSIIGILSVVLLILINIPSKKERLWDKYQKEKLNKE